MTVTLTGFMGCGKTSVGRVLGDSLGIGVVDLDGEIERRQGRSVAEIFSSEGETGFRAIEKIVLRDVLSDGRDKVVSLGGGSVLDPENAQIVRTCSICIYLRAGAHSLAGWLEGAAEQSRPLLRREAGTGLEARVASLLTARDPLYTAAAHHIIDVDEMTYSEIAERIRSLL